MAKSRGAGNIGIEFTAEVYKAASIERAGSLRKLYDGRQYVLAIYIAGVAVEAMFRAYRCRVNQEFSFRHDLYSLAKESGFASRVPELYSGSYAADLGIVAATWSNSHRYRSEAALRNFVKRAMLDRGIKGDALKENARRTVNAALGLVSLGARIWRD